MIVRDPVPSLYTEAFFAGVRYRSGSAVRSGACDTEGQDVNAKRRLSFVYTWKQNHATTGTGLRVVRTVKEGT